MVMYDIDDIKLRQLDLTLSTVFSEALRHRKRLAFRRDLAQ